MDGKHTPGPWHYYTHPQPNGCPIVGNSKGLMVAMLSHSINQPEQEDEAIANAKLIVAAPDLLNALVMARELLDLEGYVADGPSMKCVAAAIAKATT